MLSMPSCIIPPTPYSRLLAPPSIECISGMAIELCASRCAGCCAVASSGQLLQVLLPQVLRAADLAQLHALLLQHLVDQRRSLQLRVQLHHLLLCVTKCTIINSVTVLQADDLLAEIVLHGGLAPGGIVPHGFVVLQTLGRGEGAIASLVGALVGVIFRVETHVDF